MSINALSLRLNLDQFFPLEFFQVTKIGLINTIKTVFMINYLIWLEEK